MIKLEQLPQISNHVLSGLHADDTLKQKIFQQAVQHDNVFSRRISRRSIAVLCVISAIMIGAIVLLDQIQTVSKKDTIIQETAVTASANFDTFIAGERMNESPVNLGMILNQASEKNTTFFNDAAEDEEEQSDSPDCIEEMEQ